MNWKLILRIIGVVFLVIGFIPLIFSIMGMWILFFEPETLGQLIFYILFVGFGYFAVIYGIVLAIIFFVIAGVFFIISFFVGNNPNNPSWYSFRLKTS